MYPSKGIQKNMLKAYDFTKNKFCHIFLDDNFQKKFPNKYSWEHHWTDVS